jgi:hypothetical protein
VYLDEVSVISLLSSRFGAIATEFTDTLTDSMKAELNSAVSADLAIIKSNVGSRFESTRTQNSQVLRKATIQATFKQLYLSERDRLVVQPLTAALRDGSLSRQDAERLIALPNDKDASPWIIDADQLVRGGLVELEVELQADPIFKVSAIMSTLVEITKGSEDIIPQVDQSELNKVLAVNRILEKLMAGLVPVRCRVLDYAVVTIGQKEYVVHQALLGQLPVSSRPTTRPLHLVGVAEQALFWKDIRQVLFSGARVRVLARLNYAGVSKSWTPVKLVDVLRVVLPGIADEINQAGSRMLQAMVNNAVDQAGVSDFEQRAAALVAYGESLAGHYGLNLDSETRSYLALLASENAHALASVAEGRQAFQAIDDALKHHVEIERTVAAQLRLEAYRQAGLSVYAGAAPQPSLMNPISPSEDPDPVLDVEIIAIYW